MHSLFSLSQVWVKGQHIKRSIASRALAIKSCHHVWSQLQQAWLFQMIGSGQTDSFFGLKVHFCTQQMSKSLYSKEMPLLCLLTYTAHKSLHRRPWPKWEEFSRLVNCSHELFKLWAFSKRQFGQSFFGFVFHSFKIIMVVLLIRHSWLRDQNANYFSEVKYDFIKEEWSFMRECILVTWKSW